MFALKKKLFLDSDIEVILKDDAALNFNKLGARKPDIVILNMSEVNANEGHQDNFKICKD